MLTMVVAVDRNRAIGRNGDLPWRQSSDLKHFKNLTMGSTIVMGRATFESIGRALPGRRNVVMSRDSQWSSKGVEVMNYEQVIALGESNEVFIIGGGEIYQLFMPVIEAIEMTIIDTAVEDADTWFPEILEFVEVSRDECLAQEGDDHDMVFAQFRRAD